MFEMATVKLNDGTEMPMIGLGTWMSEPGKAGAAVKHAIEVGYRHIDCAHGYQNEGEIGQYMTEVWKSGKVKREDVYVVSKLWCSYFAKEDVVDACKLTLKNLQLDYLDLYLVHVPARLDRSIGDGICKDDKVGLKGYTPELMKETWQEMEKLVELGLVKSIGVSNFTCKKIADLLEFAKIKPVCNQVELHPFLPQSKLVNFCKEKGRFIHVEKKIDKPAQIQALDGMKKKRSSFPGIVCSAYSPIGAPNRPAIFQDPSHPILLENDVINSIAEKHKASPAQVILAWGIQRGVPVLPKSVTLSRIEENLKTYEVKLDSNDITKMNDLKPRVRYVDQRWGLPKGVTMEEYWDGEYLS